MTIAGRDDDACSTGDFDISHDLTIRGAGADDTIVDAAGLDRLFHVLADTTFTLEDVTLRNGDADGDGGGVLNTWGFVMERSQITGCSAANHGGAVENAAEAMALIKYSTLYDNTAQYGGAVDSRGGITTSWDLEIYNSTVSGNTASVAGGGVYVHDGLLYLTNATVAANHAANGGGVSVRAGTVSPIDSIVAENEATVNPDVTGIVESAGTNLIGDVGTSSGWTTTDLLNTDARLGPLQDNGGPTWTHGLALDSPAIDAGAGIYASDDQRGILRPQDAELVSNTVTTTYQETVDLYFADMNTDPGWAFDAGTAPYEWSWGTPSGAGTGNGDPNGGYTGDNVVGFNLAGDYSNSIDPPQYAVTPAIDCSGAENITLVFYGWLGIEESDYDHASVEVSNDGINWTTIWEHSAGTVSPTTWTQYAFDISDVAEDESQVYVRWGMGTTDGSVTYPGWNIDDVLVTGDIFISSSAETSFDIGALERYYSEIHGCLYLDDNANGIEEAWESGLGGVEVYVDINDNGRYDLGEPTTVTDEDDPLTTGIDESGTYSLDGVEPGTHRIVPLVATGWEQTLREVSSNIERVNEATWQRDVSCLLNATAASISEDGRYVVFLSDDFKVIPHDNTLGADVFVHDRHTGSTEMVSVDNNGNQANFDSIGLAPDYKPAISGDGRYVAFISFASNLAPQDTNFLEDVFVHDRETGTTERVSVSSDGVEADEFSLHVSISSDGRYVVFETGATNLVADDTNGASDIFVHDRRTGITERVSISSNGIQGDGDSYYPTISADGRYVAFESDASNLVTDDTNGVMDVFVHDRLTGVTRRVSAASDGSEGNSASGGASISADGSCVAFASAASNLVDNDTNNEMDVFVHDLQTSTTGLISVAWSGESADGASFQSSINATGRYVVFTSSATNVVSSDTNFVNDIFLHDRETGETRRVSVATDGSETDESCEFPSVSADGRYVGFSMAFGGLDPAFLEEGGAFVHDCQTLETKEVSVITLAGDSASWAISPTISGDGRYVAFESRDTNLTGSDTNDARDIFVHDRETKLIERISIVSQDVQPDGDSTDAAISANGRYVAFESEATNLVADDTNGVKDVFVFDRTTQATERVSVASEGLQTDASSEAAAISSNGRYIVFESAASNLFGDDTNEATDIFLYDRQTGETSRISVALDGTESNESSHDPTISADGRYVAFMSDADNLVAGDSNGTSDIFVYDRQLGTTERVSVSSDGVQADSGSTEPSISADGMHVVFTSSAENLVLDDTNLRDDVFVFDRSTRTVRRVSVDSNGSQSSPSPSFALEIAASISGDGRYVTFASDATDLVSNDTNNGVDVFLHDCTTGTTSLLTVGYDGTQGTAGFGDLQTPVISDDGRYVAFSSQATNLVPDDENGWDDIFVAVNQTAWQEATSSVSLASAECTSGVDLTVRPLPGKIRGRLFDDRDRSGSEDISEPGLAGWTVYLDSDFDGEFDANEPSATTDGLGYFTLADIPPFQVLHC